MEFDNLNLELNLKLKRRRKKSSYKKVNNELRHKLINMVFIYLTIGLLKRLSTKGCGKNTRDKLLYSQDNFADIQTWEESREEKCRAGKTTEEFFNRVPKNNRY